MNIKVTSLVIALFLSTNANLSFAAKAPNFKISSLTSNKKISLKKYRNRVVYLDFWASWCTPCKQSFPWMNKMQDDYKLDGFKILAISLDENKSDAVAFLKQVKANFDMAHDPDGITAEKYQVEVMPSSYLIDRKGNIVHVHKGFKSQDKAKMEAKIKSLLKKKR